jgi:hypothetical protein
LSGRIRRLLGSDRIAEELARVREQLSSLARPVAVDPATPALPAVPAVPPDDRAHDELRAEVESLRADVADLRAAVSAATGGQRTESLRHEQLAGQYQVLVTQHFYELARLRLGHRSGNGGPGRGRAIARLVRELVAMMLAGGPVDEEDLAAWLVDDGSALTDPEWRCVHNVCDQTRRLRADLARCRQPMTLVDEVPRGEPAAPGTTKAWRGCASDGAAEFVVAPSYVVAGEVLTPALVFTTAQGATVAEKTR